MSTNSVPPNSHGNEKRELFAKLYARIVESVNDPGMFESTPRRMAKAVVDGHIPVEELLAVLADCRQKISVGEVLYPGRYFVTCAKHLFSKHGLDWRKPWR